MMKNWFFILGVICSFVGCSSDGSSDANQKTKPTGPSGPVFGSPSSDELFAPYQGSWKLETRQFDPPLNKDLPVEGPDRIIQGHIIQTATGGSYMRLCQVRKVDDGIECEAWHAESLNNPVDMKRVECQLRLLGESLEMRWRMVDVNDYVEEPIIAAADYVKPARPTDPNAPWWIETYSKKAE